MTNDTSLKSKKYIKNSSDVDDSYGNKDNVRDEKDVNFDLKNSVKNNLYITIPSGTNGINYANYIVNDPNKIESKTITYSNDMTIAEKLSLLMKMKENIRNQIIKNLKAGSNTDFYDTEGNEKIPFVAYWKMIQPLEKSTYIKLTASKQTLSWKQDATIKAQLYDNSNTLIDGDLVSDFDGTHTTKNGGYTFTVPTTDRTVGKKTYQVSYDGLFQKYKPCSNSITLTFTKDTPTIKALTSNSVYKTYHAKYQFLDSQKKPIAKTAIQIKVGSEAWKNYTTDKNGIVSIAITKSIKIRYKFNGNDYYNSVAEKSQSFTVKDNKIANRCTGQMTQSPTSRTQPYQIWSKTSNDCTTSGYLRCGHESTGYSNVNTLGSKNGTYHQPAVLIKSNWNLNVSKEIKIKSIHVQWAEKQTNGPSASTSTTSFINIKKVTLDISGAITFKKTIDTNSGGSSNGGKWVSHDLNIGTNFTFGKPITLKLAYGPNTSENVGTIYVKGPKIVIEYIPVEK